MMNVLWVIVCEKEDGSFELVKNDKGEVEAFEDIGSAKSKQAEIAGKVAKDRKDEVVSKKLHIMEYVCTFYSSGMGRQFLDKSNVKVRHDKN